MMLSGAQLFSENIKHANPLLVGCKDENSCLGSSRSRIKEGFDC
jgi:hypothetical protein